MADWLETFAAALDENLSDQTSGVGAEERNLLLGLAREVAHGTERKNAPLATYIAGRYVALRGTDEALTEALEVARSTLPEIEET
jgi:hypothetical protein